MDASGFTEDPNTANRLKKVSSELVASGEQTAPFDLVLLTSTWQSCLLNGNLGRRFLKLYPQGSRSLSNDHGLVWASSDNRLKKHMRMSGRSGDSRSSVERGADLFVFGLEDVNVYLLVMHFSHDHQSQTMLVSSHFLAQTLDVLVSEKDKSHWETGLYVNNQNTLASSSWLWVNPMLISPAGYIMGKECDKYFECRREKESFIPTGEEIKQLSPYEPQVLKIKLRK